MAAKDDYLAEVFRQAQLTLIRIITGSSSAGTKTYYNTVLRQLEKLMRQLSAETGKFIDMTVPAAYREGLDAVYDYFTRNGLAMKQPDMFARINSDAVHELCNEMQHHIDSGISQAGRRVIRYVDSARDNALRQSGLRSSAVKIAAGQTVRDMQKELTKRLSEEGFLTVQYGSGDKAYQVSLESYAAMVSRSTTREAGNLARENQLVHNGYDLMMMTEHYPTCPVCAMLQGRVYSISGNDKRFPPLSRAFSSGYKNVHPNCSHVMTPWIEELQSPEELKEALEKSGRPFQDLRSEEERALYSQQQAQARQLRADRSQFQRYKARLGDKAPSGFAQFRKLKTAGGEPWEELAKSYRESVDRSGVPEGREGAVPQAENVNDQSIDKSEKSGIIKAEGVSELEQAKKRDHKIFITDTAVDKVGRVELSDLSTSQVNDMQNKHKELLTISRTKNNCDEVLFIDDLSLKSEVQILGSEFSVSPGKNPFAVSVIMNAQRQSLIYMHNHPSTNNFSIADIDTFICESAIKIMTVVTNQGEVYALNKTSKYDYNKTRQLMRAVFESFDGEFENQEFVKKFLKRCSEGGIEYAKSK